MIEVSQESTKKKRKKNTSTQSGPNFTPRPEAYMFGVMHKRLFISAIECDSIMHSIMGD